VSWTPVANFVVTSVEWNNWCETCADFRGRLDRERFGGKGVNREWRGSKRFDFYGIKRVDGM
jgi:hypothetical protein